MKTYTIKELSKMFDLPASTLRYYEDERLLEHVIHSDNGQRLYTDEHIARLYAILCFKRTGLSISKMQLFFSYEKQLPEHIDDILTLVKEQEKDTSEKLRKLKEDLTHIQHKVRYYSAIKEALKNGTPFPCWEDC